MNIVDVLNQIWTQILEVTSIFVMPDWTFVISLLPVIVLLGLVMPFLTGLVLGTGAYLVTKPRVKVAFEEGPRVAADRRRRRAGLPGRTAPLPARRAGLSVRHDPLRTVPATRSRSSARCAGSAARRRSTPAPTAVSCSRSSRARWRSGRRPDPSPAAQPSPESTAARRRMTQPAGRPERP